MLKRTLVIIIHKIKRRNEHHQLMKNYIKIVILLMITGFFTACQQPQSCEQALADETQRKEVMQTIANNHEMMTEMMDIMMSSEHGKNMMTGNKDMMGMMMGDQQMMKGMMDMMHQKGMMNDECYKNGMDVMGKGMMKGNGMP